MLCPCHKQDRRRGIMKTSHQCQNKSRRLKEAISMKDEFAWNLRTAANELTLDDAEQDGQLHLWLVNALRGAAADVVTRFQYLSSIPVLFAIADTQEGASRCLMQWRVADETSHDFFSINFMRTYGADIERVASGGECRFNLQEEIRLINTAPLDESAGEGYHRGTHHVRLQCPGAKAPYIKQSLRLKENIALMKKFLAAHKRKGRQILRYDWANYKRVLQTHTKDRWRAVRMKTAAFYSRLYRMDSMAQESWARWVTKPGTVVVPGAPRQSHAQELTIE